jgi:hypothetical protein
VIISYAKGIVDAQQYLFDTLWSKAIPAEKRIKELRMVLFINLWRIYLVLMRSMIS